MIRRALLALLVAVALPAGMQAQGFRDAILELRNASQLERIAERHAIEVLDEIPGQGIFLVRVENDPGKLRRLQRENGVVGVEDNRIVSLPPGRAEGNGGERNSPRGRGDDSEARNDGRGRPGGSDDSDDGNDSDDSDLDSTFIWLFGEDETAHFYGASADSAYVDQPAVELAGVRDALSLSNGAGTKIAFIDTGVDPDHPALRSWVDAGVDLLGTGSTSEWSGIDSTFIWLFEEFKRLFETGDLDSTFIWLFSEAVKALGDEPEVDSTFIWLFDEAIEVFSTSGLDSTFIWLFGEEGLAAQLLPPKFGHGTLVAGMLHLVAPEARLVPIRAFDSYGNSTLYLTTAAVYAAVDGGADVINMSFTVGEDSPLFKRALDYAWSEGVALVASAGNDASDASYVYPAAYANVISVGATDLDDRIASFSNYGGGVDLMAPGEMVVSTYPGNLYAYASGTSFSAPMVSGAVALLMSLGERNGAGSAWTVNNADDIDDLNPGYERSLGAGRLNARASIGNRHTGGRQ